MDKKEFRRLNVLSYNGCHTRRTRQTQFRISLMKAGHGPGASVGTVLKIDTRAKETLWALKRWAWGKQSQDVMD